VRTSPSQLSLLFLLLSVGVLVTCWQVEAIASWRPTVTVHLGMGLVAAGVLCSLIPQFRSRSRIDA